MFLLNRFIFVANLFKNKRQIKNIARKWNFLKPENMIKTVININFRSCQKIISIFYYVWMGRMKLTNPPESLTCKTTSDNYSAHSLTNSFSHANNLLRPSHALPFDFHPKKKHPRKCQPIFKTIVYFIFLGEVYSFYWYRHCYHPLSIINQF